MNLTWPLRIVEERRDGVLVLILAGRLGVESAARLDAAVAEAVGRGDVRLVLDLSRVDYVSSAGLKAFEDAAGRCTRAHGAMALCGLVDAVRIAVDLGGLASMLPIESSRDLAIARAATVSA